MHPVYDKTLSRKRCKELWLELLAQYGSSGLSKREFAQNHEINVEDLKRWHYRFSDKSKKESIDTHFEISSKIRSALLIEDLRKYLHDDSTL